MRKFSRVNRNEMYEMCTKKSVEKMRFAGYFLAFFIFWASCTEPIDDLPERDSQENTLGDLSSLISFMRIKLFVKIDSVAFPAISTGAFGYPLEEATDVALSVLQERLPDSVSLEKLRFVLFSDSDLQLYREKLDQI